MGQAVTGFLLALFLCVGLAVLVIGGMRDYGDCPKAKMPTMPPHDAVQRAWQAGVRDVARQ